MEEEKYKYICEQCDYKCRFDSEWKKHCETTLHKTGERKKKDNYKENGKCKDCEYITTNTFLMKKHRLNEHATKEEREKEFKFYCKCCDIGTFSKDIYEKHIGSEKHKKYLEKSNK